MWDRAKDFVQRSGWIPVEVPVRSGGRALPPLIMWQDHLRPDREPVYLHEAEAIQDRREYVVRSVMES